MKGLFFQARLQCSWAKSASWELDPLLFSIQSSHPAVFLWTPIYNTPQTIPSVFVIELQCAVCRGNEAVSLDPNPSGHSFRIVSFFVRNRRPTVTWKSFVKDKQSFLNEPIQMCENIESPKLLFRNMQRLSKPKSNECRLVLSSSDMWKNYEC